MLSLWYLLVKAQQHFVTSSCMFLDEKTVLEIWLDLGLNLTIFRGTGPNIYQSIKKKMIELLRRLTTQRKFLSLKWHDNLLGVMYIVQYWIFSLLFSHVYGFSFFSLW